MEALLNFGIIALLFNLYWAFTKFESYLELYKWSNWPEMTSRPTLLWLLYIIYNMSGPLFISLYMFLK